MTGLSRRSSSWIWLLVLFSVASLVETIYYGQITAFTPLHLPKLGVLTGADVTMWTGRVAALAGILGIPFLPLWGALADRYSRQPVIVRSFVAHLLSGVVMLLAGNVWVFAIGRALTGFALGNSGLMLTTLSEHTPQRRIGLAFAIMSSAGPIGAFVGPLLGGPIVDRWGFPALLIVDATLLLAIILSLAFGYRDSFQGKDSGPLLKMAWESVLIIGRSALLITIFLSMFLIFAGWMLAFTYIPLIVGQIVQGSDPGQRIGLVMGIGGLAALIIAPAMGALADRFGHWRMLFIGVILMIVCWPLPMLTRSLTLFTALWGLVNGVSSGVFSISFTVLSGSIPGQVRGRVMSFAYLPVNLGGTLGPALGSVITRTDIFLIFPVAALITVMGLIMLVVAFWLVKSAPRPQPAESQAQ